MKKIFLVLVICTLLVVGFFSVVAYKWRVHNDHSGNISIKVKETDDIYQLYASYSRHKTRKIQKYLDAELNERLFRNTKIDATVTLPDETSFYVRSIPGRLLIRLNKEENSAASYNRIKRLGEGIKLKLGENY
jgi:hypothetical protein